MMMMIMMMMMMWRLSLYRKLNRALFRIVVMKNNTNFLRLKYIKPQDVVVMRHWKSNFLLESCGQNTNFTSCRLCIYIANHRCHWLPGSGGGQAGCVLPSRDGGNSYHQPWCLLLAGVNTSGEKLRPGHPPPRPDLTWPFMTNLSGARLQPALDLSSSGILVFNEISIIRFRGQCISRLGRISWRRSLILRWPHRLLAYGCYPSNYLEISEFYAVSHNYTRGLF
jgi:hypothetical protein